MDSSALTPESRTTKADAPSSESDTEDTLADFSKRQNQNKIPVEMNLRVKKWLKYFTTTGRAPMQRFINRGAPYKKQIQGHFEREHMPRDLYYVAMIESGFQTHAVSPAKAVGFWQFMPRTGSHYGLLLSPQVDERRDPVRSTVAASKYFKDLHNIFHSWYLAIAAYNAGEYRIINAIKKAKTRDFWELAQRRMLPQETMDYVPKFLAAAIISNSPESYGFTRPAFPDGQKTFTAEVPTELSLSTVAAFSGVSAQELKRLNPQLLKGVVPEGRGATYNINISKDMVSRFSGESVQKMAEFKVEQRLKKSKRLVAAQRMRQDGQKPQSRIHRVKKGETLYAISQKYGLTVTKLKSLNNLTRDTVYSGQVLKMAKYESQKARRTF
jgi:membrane-bound lytic murein transglycosylase D